MADLQDYKCPCCGGAINFDAKKQKMKCPYCDSEFEMESVKKYDESFKNIKDDSMKWKQKENQWTSDETKDLVSYVCNSCGGEIIGDNNTAATQCPYCGNSVVVKKAFSGTLKPDLVIPFKLSKEDAKAAYENHLKGKKLLPKIFKEKNQIEKIQGIYVPFWLYNADVDAKVIYKASRGRSYQTNSEDITETNYFQAVREGSVSFTNVPVDGSVKMDDALMESIEPFNMEEAVEFQSAYLAGYLADKYDVSMEENQVRANERIKRSTEEILATTVEGYSTVTAEQSSINVKNGTAKYALLPTWVLSTKFKDKSYTFAMNGQTGKFVGDLPMDLKKAIFSTIGTFLVSGGLAFLILNIISNVL